MILLSSKIFGYILIIVVVAILSVGTYLIRKKFNIGVYTKEEESNMKSNLDLLLKEEDIEEGKDYTDEV